MKHFFHPSRVFLLASLVVPLSGAAFHDKQIKSPCPLPQSTENKPNQSLSIKNDATEKQHDTHKNTEKPVITKEMLYQKTGLIRALIQKKTKDKPVCLQPINPTLSLEPKNAEQIELIAKTLSTTLKSNLKKNLNKGELSLLKHESLNENSCNLNAALMRLVKIPKEATLHIVGDLHGDDGPIKAIMNRLIAEKKFDPINFTVDKLVYVAFLGDYIDRGPKSVRVLALLTKLLAANPEQVLLLRGNHESKSMAMCSNPASPSLWDSLKKIVKKNEAGKLLNLFLKAFSRLPVIIFVQHGTKEQSFALVHGGINPSINLTQEEISTIQSHLDAEQPTSWVIPKGNAQAYLWSDLENSDETLPAIINEERGNIGYILYKNNIEYWLLLFGLKQLFRGHQQNDSLFIFTEAARLPYSMFSGGPWLGVGSWNNLATTANLAPNTGYYEELEENDEEDGFYCEYGTWIELSQKPAGFKNPPKTERTKPRLLHQSLNWVLTPHYFDPKTQVILDL